MARLAERAHLSPHHGHRTYHALHGETLAATVRRLRLQRASGELATVPAARPGALAGLSVPAD